MNIRASRGVAVAENTSSWGMYDAISLNVLSSISLPFTYTLPCNTQRKRHKVSRVGRVEQSPKSDQVALRTAVGFT